jgi:hypothetical protein
MRWDIFWLLMAIVGGYLFMIIGLHSVTDRLDMLNKNVAKLEERTRFMDLSLEILKP